LKRKGVDKKQLALSGFATADNAEYNGDDGYYKQYVNKAPGMKANKSDCPTNN
jgi:hypothetical protein